MRSIEHLSLEGEFAIPPTFPKASDFTGATAKLLSGAVVLYNERIDKWCRTVEG